MVGRLQLGRAVSGLTRMGAFVSLFVAVLDEFAQGFVGRISLVSDVLIDFSGALTGIALFAAAFWLLARRRRA